MVQEFINQSFSVPKSILNASRKEFIDKMQIDGKLPNDLQGHVFIVGPVGTIDSNGLPPKDGNTYLNGDGMIYRLDFDKKGEVTWKTQIVKPLDYFFDVKTENQKLLKFRNFGIIRFSLVFGFRNELNTAFLPMKFPGDLNERLLVTYDAGRPYEIDTETLEVVTPVGERKEWQAATKLPYRFPPILSTAHPIFDTYTHQMFTVNYGRSLGNLLGREQANDYINLLEEHQQQLPQKYAQLHTHFLKQLISKADVITHGDFVHLLCWDGTGSLQRWKLVNPDGSPVSIKQSMHQMGITEDYIVLMDTSFITGIEQLINNPLPTSLDDHLEEAIRKLLKRKPSPDSTLYIVSRHDLQEGQDSVVVREITIPREACHFLVDYRNPDNKITLHIAHICAWNVAEWIRRYDTSPYDHKLIPQPLHGMQQCELDISVMGRYVIDLSNQEPTIESKLITHDTCTWGAGLFTYLDRLPSSGTTPEKLDNIYWVSFGLWKDLVTDFICDLYRDYPYRQKSLDEVLELAKNSAKPSCLFRLHTSSNEAMEIPDYFAFPKEHIAVSPQFVPRSEGEESSTNGYIVCVVSTPKRNEIWIFDAENLQQGPLCKLFHPNLDFGFSFHTTWLKNISSRQASYKASKTRNHRSLIDNTLSFMETDLSSITKDEKDDIEREVDDINFE